MAKIDPLSDVGNLVNMASARATINQNAQRIEEAFDNTLSRDGSGPNEMHADIDLNSHKLLNVAAGEADTDAANLGQVREELARLAAGPSAAATAGVPFTVNVTEGQTDVPLPGLKTPWVPQAVFYNGIFQDPGAYKLSSSGLTFTEPLPVPGRVVVVAVYGSPTQITESDALTFKLQAADSITRPVSDKLGETVSVKDFGALPGGGNVKEQLRAAVNALAARGGGRLFLPSGTYVVGDAADSQIVLSSDMHIYGEPGTVIHFHDDPSVAVASGSTNRLFYMADTDGVTFEGITFTGTALDYTDPTTNAKQLIGGVRNTNVTFKNCTFRNLRHMAVAMGGTRGAVVQGCTFENIGRDGARFTHSQNVTISGNVFKNVSDDTIALHSVDTGYTYPVPSGHVVSGNVFEGCNGIRALGAKGVTISGNTFRRCFGKAIHIEQGWSGAEGNTPQFAINITGNTILDTLSLNTTGSSPIAIISVVSAARDFTGLSDKPGVNAPPYAYNYINGTDISGTVNVGAHSISITNNVIARTLPVVAKYSDWGYGQFFDHRNLGGFYADPAVTDAEFQLHGIFIKGPADAVMLSGNLLAGLSPNYSAFLFDTAGSANTVDLSDVVIQGNIVRDCPGNAIAATATGSGVAARSLVVQNNLFDLDPFFRHPSHNSDNTWATGGALRALSTAGGSSVFTGNVCRNLSQPTSVGENAGHYYADNYLWCDPTGGGNNASNKGVRVLDVGQIVVVYDADPASATYGQVTTFPAATASAMPSSGFYCQGHVVRRTTPVIAGAASSQYVVTGWVRITTGTSHVAGTDWAEMRTLTGT